MSTFRQLRELLDYLREVHDRAAACCADAGCSEDERVNLWVDFFRQWEQRLEQSLERLQQEQREAFLDTWVQFAPTEDIDKALRELEQARDESPETLVRKCFDLREQILALIDLLADRLKAPAVRQQLSGLADFERKTAKNLGVADIMRHDA